jgi:hypothetical protein
MIKVSPRAHRHEDRAGDPLDGLVNLFDLGIVLSVAFLLAALSSLNLEAAITDTGLTQPKDQITVPEQSTVDDVPPDGKKVVGRGSKVGTVYRLDDGRLIYVVPSSPSASPAASPTPTP